MRTHTLIVRGLNGFYILCDWSDNEWVWICICGLDGDTYYVYIFGLMSLMMTCSGRGHPSCSRGIFENHAQFSGSRSCRLLLGFDIDLHAFVHSCERLHLRRGEGCYRLDTHGGGCTIAECFRGLLRIPHRLLFRLSSCKPSEMPGTIVGYRGVILNGIAA